MPFTDPCFIESLQIVHKRSGFLYTFYAIYLNSNQKKSALGLGHPSAPQIHIKITIVCL